jgi:hypothetical protein
MDEKMDVRTFSWQQTWRRARVVPFQRRTIKLTIHHRVDWFGIREWELVRQSPSVQKRVWFEVRIWCRITHRHKSTTISQEFFHEYLL